MILHRHTTVMGSTSQRSKHQGNRAIYQPVITQTESVPGILNVAINTICTSTDPGVVRRGHGVVPGGSALGAAGGGPRAAPAPRSAAKGRSRAALRRGAYAARQDRLMNYGVQSDSFKYCTFYPKLSYFTRTGH